MSAFATVTVVSEGKAYEVGPVSWLQFRTLIDLIVKHAGDSVNGLVAANKLRAIGDDDGFKRGLISTVSDVVARSDEVVGFLLKYSCSVDNHGSLQPSVVLDLVDAALAANLNEKLLKKVSNIAARLGAAMSVIKQSSTQS